MHQGADGQHVQHGSIDQQIERGDDGDANKGGARHIALGRIDLLAEIDCRLPAAISAIDRAQRHHRGDPAEGGRRRRIGHCGGMACEQGRHQHHQSHRLQRGADILRIAAGASTDPIQPATGRHQQDRDLARAQSRQRSQTMNIFAERHGDEAGGDGELAPVRPADQKTAARPDRAGDDGIRPAGQGNGGAQLHRGHGVDGDEEAAACPRQQYPKRIGKADRHHGRITHDAGTDHAADHHRQAKAQAEDAQQMAAQCNRWNGIDESYGDALKSAPPVSRHAAAIVKASFRE